MNQTEQDPLIEPDEVKIDKQRSKDEAEKKQRELTDLNSILKTPAGRRFIWKLLSKAGMFHVIFTSNAKLEDFNLGRRSIGLELLAEVNEVDTGAYPQMQAEYISEQKSRKK
jgi:hypothetical protein